MASATAVLHHGRTPTRSNQMPDPTPRRPVLDRVEVTLLGGFEVRVGDHTISANHWPRRHSAALIKLLALAPGRSLHREQVLEALWPGLDLDVTAARLHKAAHYARKALGHRDAVVLSADAVRLCPQTEVQVDAARFQRLARSALENGGIAAAKSALAVYGGALLPHDLYEPWAEQHRLHLGRLYTELLHQAEDWHQALSADPADELAHLALARRYAEIGDRGAALRQLDQVMLHELGLEPSEQAAALRRKVLAAAASVSTNGVDHPAALQVIRPGPPCCAQVPVVGVERDKVDATT